MRDATISLAIMPSLPVKRDHIVCGGWGPSARRRDASDASGRLTSFNVEGRGSRTLPRSSWRVLVDAGPLRPVRVRGRHLNGRQPSGLNN